MRPTIPLILSVLWIGSAAAQTPTHQTGPQGMSQPCPAPQASAAKEGPGGNEPPDQQAVERSAILPSAGQHEQSAAPTVQQNGEAVVAQTECPKPPNHPNAPKTQ